MQADQEKCQNQVQIDQQWICAGQQLIIDPHLLMCQVCYGIPLQGFAQCEQCGRIFCQNDYNQVKSSLNFCPNCKNSPFKKKIKPHILYTSLFSRITFNCKICDQKEESHQESSILISDEVKQSKINNKQQKMEPLKSSQSKTSFEFNSKLILQSNQPQSKQQNDKKVQYKDQKQNSRYSSSRQQSHKTQSSRIEKQVKRKFTKQELSDHILNYHNKKIMDYQILFDFQIHFEKDNQKISFDMYQNILLNQKYQEIKLKKKINQDFPYQLQTGTLVVINFEKQIVTKTTLNLKKVGKLIKRPSKILKKGVQYEVWSVLLDVDHVNYPEKIQEMIKNEHNQFIKNKRKNQFTFDLGNQRYRISFNKMVQINTYTGYERPIRKNTIKFF